MDDIVKLEVQRWIILAGDDLAAAKELIQREPPISRNACFHAQQCAEKSFKAYLVSKGQHVEKTHFLLHLHTICKKLDKDFHEYREHARDLTDYAVSPRYPDDWREIPVKEAEEAVEKAEEVMTFVMKKLAIYL